MKDHSCDDCNLPLLKKVAQTFVNIEIINFQKCLDNYKNSPIKIPTILKNEFKGQKILAKKNNLKVQMKK